MRMLFVQSLRKGLPPLLMAFALNACGPSESQNGPAFFAGDIVIAPSAFTLTVAPDLAVPPSVTPCASNPATFPIFAFLITVLDDQNRPIGNADIEITLDFAGNTTTGITGTFLIDGGTIVSNPGAPVPYKTETDKFGNKQLFISFLDAAGCEFNGSMTVISGSLFKQMQWDVSL